MIIRGLLDVEFEHVTHILGGTPPGPVEVITTIGGYVPYAYYTGSKGDYENPPEPAEIEFGDLDQISIYNPILDCYESVIDSETVAHWRSEFAKALEKERDYYEQLAVEAANAKVEDSYDRS